MAGNRDTNKRLKAIGIPIELCVKYERLCGIQAGKKLSFADKFHVSEAMISALEAGVRNVQLSSEDYQIIAEEVKKNEESRCGQLLSVSISGFPSETDGGESKKGGKRK